MTSLLLVSVPFISLAVTLVTGKPMIRLLKRIGAGQHVRDDGPERHLGKEGTPTMGGIMIAAVTLMTSAAASWLLSDSPSRFGVRSTDNWYIPLTPSLILGILVLAFAAIGFADDFLKIRRGRSLGLRAREKLALQVIAAAVFVSVLIWQHVSAYDNWSSVPETFHYSAIPFYAAFWMLTALATSNAVNLADGLDGLAGGLCIIAVAGFAWLGWQCGGLVGLSVCVFALSLLGACLGFLWFNRHPARVFMGDVGSLALGAAMAGMAAMLDKPWALIGLCFVPFVEEASVIIQVISFKTTGRRVFKMSPIHHHFELIGWSEQRVVYTFWAVGAVAAAITVWLRLV